VKKHPRKVPVRREDFHTGISGDETEIYGDDTEIFGDNTEIFGEPAQPSGAQPTVARLTSVLGARNAIAAGDYPTAPGQTRRLDRNAARHDRSDPWIAPPVGEHTAAMTGAPAWIPEESVRGTDTGTRSAWDEPERLAESSVPLTIGAVLNERFELVEVLGRGGMGVVYRAIDRRKVDFGDSDHFVAIKVLNEEFKRHPEAIRTLQLESKKSMKLAHPNIVQVRDFDRADGNVYMVMELLEGHSLQQLLREQYPKGMPLRLVIDIVRGLGDALAHAHDQGIVHSDFKPSNAFITRAGHVKVLDFGVARVHHALDPGQTVFDVGSLKALSPPYASIELMNGAAPDPRDDVYALACVTYLLLTGRHPFGEMTAMRARHEGLAPARIRGLPAEAWQALTAALAFERNARTQTIRELVAHFCGAGQRRRRAWIPGVAVLILAAGAAAALYLRREPVPAEAVPTSSVNETIAGPLAAAIEPAVIGRPEAGTAAPAAAAESDRTEPASVANAPPSPEQKQRATESFQERAAQQMLDGDPDAAMATLATARRRMGYGNADLKNMEFAFARAGEEFDRIRTAASLSVAAHRQYLDEIRQASGDDLYPQVEQMLAGTLANQIADLRARGDRDSVAAALLESGRKLFPNHAALLEKGTPGVLGSAPVAVDEDRQDQR
jgi:serine/threonine protein kinase